ncbi:surface protease GP63, partial [Trypanosoma cruzi]
VRCGLPADVLLLPQSIPDSFTMWCAPTARFISFTVGRMHLRAQDALHLCSGVWKDPWVPVRIKTSTTDPCDSNEALRFLLVSRNEFIEFTVATVRMVF